MSSYFFQNRGQEFGGGATHFPLSVLYEGAGGLQNRGEVNVRGFDGVDGDEVFQVLACFGFYRFVEVAQLRDQFLQNTKHKHAFYNEINYLLTSTLTFLLLDVEASRSFNCSCSTIGFILNAVFVTF
jgi:hypothetical protein